MRTALQVLSDLDLESKRQRLPNLPEHAMVKNRFKDKTANDLTNSIIKFIQLKGFQAERISSEGRVIDQRKTYIDCIGRARTVGTIKRVYSSGSKGTADISTTIKGLSVKVEVKIGRDRQSEEQKRYQTEVEKAGGIYIIAKDFEGFYNWFSRKFECDEKI
jgi:hypothetical protein